MEELPSSFPRSRSTFPTKELSLLLLLVTISSFIKLQKTGHTFCLIFKKSHVNKYFLKPGCYNELNGERKNGL